VCKRYRTVLVRDAGAALAPDPRPRRFWPAQMVRVVEVIDNQVRALRKRQLIEAFRNREREGTYWGIRTDLADYGLPDAMPVPWQRSLELASVPTRLAAMPDRLQARLVNWGYAVSDAALRRHVIVRSDLRPPAFPYPGGV
jgi:NTE family protein